MARYKTVISPGKDKDAPWVLEVTDQLTSEALSVEVENPYDIKAIKVSARKLARRLYNKSRRPIKFEFDL